jgi:hypothetical protein
MNKVTGHAASSHGAMLGAASARIAAGYATMPLPVVVEAVLAELTAAARSFTAYDVTMILRALFTAPLRDLPHYDKHGVPGVQPEVHRQMAGYLAAGLYRTKTVYPNGVDAAQLYVPVRRRRGARWLTLATSPAVTGTAVPLPARAWVIRQRTR